MAKQSSFLRRIDPQVLAEVRRWADDDGRTMKCEVLMAKSNTCHVKACAKRAAYQGDRKVIARPVETIRRHRATDQ